MFSNYNSTYKKDKTFILNEFHAFFFFKSKILIMVIDYISGCPTAK